MVFFDCESQIRYTSRTNQVLAQSKGDHRSDDNKETHLETLAPLLPVPFVCRRWRA